MHEHCQHTAIQPGSVHGRWCHLSSQKDVLRRGHAASERAKAHSRQLVKLSICHKPCAHFISLHHASIHGAVCQDCLTGRTTWNKGIEGRTTIILRAAFQWLWCLGRQNRRGLFPGSVLPPLKTMQKCWCDDVFGFRILPCICQQATA